MHLRRPLCSILASIALLLGAACANDPSTQRGGAPTAAASTAPVVLEILAREVDPPGAPGRTLTLARYTIAPGVHLPAHIHPGVQLAIIESGMLTYTVVSGTATVTRRGNSATESVSGPATTTLGPGDGVAENDGMVHFGANLTERPVVILATLLTRSDRGLSEPARSIRLPMSASCSAG